MSSAPRATIGGHYRLVRPIGCGGMAIVWEAVDLASGRRVAVKLLRDAAHRRENVELLHAEARSIARASAPHVVELLEAGDDDGAGPFLVLELLHGEDLASFLGRVARVPAALAIEIAMQIAEGISHAHARGLAHGDLKPENVFLEIVNGVVSIKIIVFGIAHRSQHAPESTPPPGSRSCTYGTLPYMAPERLQGGAPDPRSDVWSVGVILYEMLAGRLPYQTDDDPAEQLTILTFDEVAPIAELATGISPSLSQLVAQLSSPDPELRPADGAAVASALARELRHTSTDESGSFVRAGASTCPHRLAETVACGGGSSHQG